MMNKRELCKKMVTGVLVFAMTATILTGCGAYVPLTSGADSVSGSAVADTASGAAVSEKKGNQVSKETDSLKVDWDGKYSEFIHVEYQSSKYFYYADCDDKKYEQSVLYQISPDGKRRKKTGIRNNKGHLDLISVDSDWVYYATDDKIYRVPIVSKGKTEILDKDKAECLVKNGVGSQGAILDRGKLYYLTVDNVKIKKGVVSGDIQIHCMDLCTGDTVQSNRKISYNDTAYKGNDYRKEPYLLGLWPESYITEDYVYYFDFDYPAYLYQLNRNTMELTIIDELENECVEYAEYDLQMSPTGAYIWYLRASGKNKKCEYEICRFDVKRQERRVLCNAADCLDVVCQAENVEQSDVEYLDVEYIEGFDENHLYMDYELELKTKKGVEECRSGVMTYSLATDRLDVPAKVKKFYKKYMYDEEDEEEEIIYRESSAEVCGYDCKENQLFLSAGTGWNKKKEKYEYVYAVYDIASDTLRNISEKTVVKRMEEIYPEW